MPYIPVFDLEQNPVRKELVAATFARGIWTFPFDSVFVQQNPVTVSLAGTVQDELGIGLLEVAVDGTLSDDNGFFSLDNLPGCASYTLAPSRNDNPLNGLTTYDLVLISKHILGIEPFTSPYKMIAADANRSGSITTFDIVQLRKLILGIDTQFASNTSWRFVPANHMFENQLNPFQAAFPETLAVQVLTVPLSNLDFTAIKIGDVNNTAVPNLNAPGAERTLNEWPIGLRWGDEDALSGTSLEASDPSAIETTHFIEAFITIPAAGISAAQFTLQFDPKRLVFEKIESQTPGISMENFGSNRIGQGLLTFAAEGLELSGETDLFKVIFRTRGKMPLTERIGLANWPTPGLLYTQDGIAFRPVLEAGNANNTSITPNPFGLTGTWVLSKTDQDIQVFDARGRLIFSKKTAVNTAIHLESSLFPHAGTYFWRMGEKTGKLVFTP
jgi:hypothetical protein